MDTSPAMRIAIPKPGVFPSPIVCTISGVDFRWWGREVLSIGAGIHMAPEISPWMTRDAAGSKARTYLTGMPAWEITYFE